MTVGDRIKELRLKTGISQVDFADKINVSKQTLYKYENNIITNIPSDKVEAAAKLCGVSPSYLMGWENIDSRFSGKEAPDDIYRKFSDNINRHHGKLKELENVYLQLSSDNQRRVNSYAQKLYDIQKMDDAIAPIAANDKGATEEQKANADSIMTDDSEWE